MTETPFILDDPRPTQKAAPYTFFLPDPRRLREIGIGDLVKLIFVPTADSTKYRAERMWVQVTDGGERGFAGKLDNVPDDVPGLKLGDAVNFQAWHVIDVQFADKQKDERLRFPRRTYYERCLVDDCILDREAAVHFLYREEPDMTRDGDRYADSGWRIRGDWRGLSDDEVEARKCSYVALGAVLNRDDSWLHLIDTPWDAQFIKNWDKNEFVPDE